MAMKFLALASPLLGTWIYSALGGHALWLVCGGLGILAVALLRIFNLGRGPASFLISLEKVQK